ncbi:hypothetical protein HERIO_2027 [Hepatospora eriocheir]|uniref:Uncharacterized protein n=1 Tax=Hepatospora eriocheir TaxID=1081669 RepID=A0A1X0Q8G7_9MICR|nr:hypothetical protein HERIO_2027 [Hepatospora eriocheir]
MISKDLLNTDSIDERDLITEEGSNDKDEHSWHKAKQQLEQELVSANILFKVNFNLIIFIFKILYYSYISVENILSK